MGFQNKYFPQLFLKSELLQSASVLFSGSVIAQLVSILLQPVTRRLFSPESFGVFTVYLSLVGIITVISSFRYDEAIVLPRSDKESINLVGLSVSINLIFNSTLFFIVLLLNKRIISFLNLPGDFPVSILYIIPFGAFLFNLYQALNFWLIRKKKYYAVSVNRLIRRGSEGIGQLTLGILKSFNGLIYSDVIGLTTSLTTVAYQSGRNGLNLRVVSFNKLKYVLKKYSEFPKYNLIPTFMSTCSYLLPPIFINKFFSPESAGYFDLSKLLLSIPLAFIASSLSSVILQRVAEKFNRKESFLTELKPVLVTVSMISVAEIVVILLLGEYIFKFIFGDQWTTSGTISRIMVWSFAFNFIIATFTSIFISMRRIKTYGAWQLIYFLAILSLLFFKHLPFADFLKIYVGIEVLCYLVVAGMMLTIVYKYEYSLRRNIKTARK